MRFLHEYINQFRDENSEARNQLADILEETKLAYDIILHGNPLTAFEVFVERYNWFGDPVNKARFGIDKNLARNLPGSLMQDYLLHLTIHLCESYPKLDVFTEVRVSFGRYPLWEAGEVSYKMPSEVADLAVGYLLEEGRYIITNQWPKAPFYRLEKHQSVLPLVTINSKIRVSQSEFFDWLGRDQLMSKGNPHCLSVQVALRKEMDMSVVEAAQARPKFFLLGSGNERTVIPDRAELNRFIETFSDHLNERMRQEPL